MSYRELHAAAEDELVELLKRKGHVAVKEYRTKYGIFDVYDKTANTCWEVVTAKIIPSGHEQKEAIVAKIFRYMLVVPKVKFLIASYDHEDLDYFHTMKLEHWHVHDGWWGGQLGKLYYHKGQSAEKLAHKIYAAMVAFAPLKEWLRPKRRAAHPNRKSDVQKINDALGLPHNFLLGIWKDWRLAWVWKLEKVLPLWAKKYGYKID